MAQITSGIPSFLETPPTSAVQPPINTRPQELPIEQLSWQDFEKLCLRLVRNEANVEHCQQYGVPGQEQEGIDIYARQKFEEKYHVYQCKQVSNFGPSQIRQAVEKFLSGTWVDKTSTFVLCTRESFTETNRAEELEIQADILRKMGIALLSWDIPTLSTKLKHLPELVDDFFGRSWVKIFCGEEAERNLGRRLDKFKVIEFRKSFVSFYRNVFSVHDPGLPTSMSDGANGLAFEERFVIPTICDRQATPLQTPSGGTGSGSMNINSLQKSMDEWEKYASDDAFTSSTRPDEYKHFLAQDNSGYFRESQNIESWLSAANRSIVLGGPGSGKSTLLRFIALDLLQENPSLTLLSQKWGQYLPVWIPFAYWTKLLSENPQTSLQELLHYWLKSWDEERLWDLAQQALDDHRLLLLVDGLDEWTNEDALQVAVDRLIVFIKQREIPAVITSRPHGFERIGIPDTDWQVGILSDFTEEQQKQLSLIWFSHRIKVLNQKSEYEEAEIIRRAENEANHFLLELQRSHDLQELAKVPLLLCLLISLHIQKASLPQSRFKAYELIIDHLVSDHPSKRRKAASLTNTLSDFPDEDIKQLLAVLAYYIQCNYGSGLIDHATAIEHIEQYLQEPQQPYGLSRKDARYQSRSLLQVGHTTIGLLVKWSQTDIGFFHRVFKEYLAAIYLATLPYEEKSSIIETNCANSQWREVILSLLHLTKTQREIEGLIRIIWEKSKSVNLSERMTVEYLLFEIAFSDLRFSADLAREIAESAFKEVETGFWLPYREQILDLILDGLRLPKQKKLVQTKLLEWFPNRFFMGRDVFHAMADWPKKQNVIDCLLKGMHDENPSRQRAAAQALAKVANGDIEVRDRLICLADHMGGDRIQAAAVKALLLGWYQDPKVSEIVRSFRYSASPILRLLAISGREKNGLLTDEDWEDLIKFGSRSYSLNYYWREDVPLLLMKGWPHSEKTKKVCLDAVLGQIANDEELDQGIALNILLQDYSNDNDVVEFCEQEIRNKDYPFLMAHMYGWSLLKDNFRGNQKIIQAIDEWLPKQQHNDPEISMAALVGRSPIAKEKLLSMIDSSFPHWIVRALLEGWGMGDSEVAAKLTEVAFGPSDKASRIGFLLPEIIEDKAECRKRLLTILKDPQCKRPDFVLDGLWILNETKSQQDNEVVDAALQLIEELNEHYVDEISDIRHKLIIYYPLDNRVRDIALEEMNKREGSYSAVAMAYKDDDTFQTKVIAIANPLPSQLRMKIASRLGESSIEDPFFLNLLQLYDYDGNPAVKTQASISYHSLLKNSSTDNISALETLSKDIVCYGPDHEERRQAAFCGLVALERLDIMFDKQESIGNKIRTSISISEGLNPNIPLIIYLLKNWEYIKGVFGDGFWEAISKHGYDKSSIWKSLCLFADQYPVPRAEAIQFFEEQGKHPIEVDTLRFIGRTLPKSRMLLNDCLSSLHLSARSYSLHELEIALTAAELLAENFKDDEDVLRNLTIKPLIYGDWVDEGRLIALCNGWPKSDELDQAWKTIKENKIPLLYPTFFQLICVKAESKTILENLLSLLSNPDHISVWTAPGISKPIIRRLGKDDRLYELLISKIKGKITPSEKATLPRLLSFARGSSPVLKIWCQEELELQRKSVQPSEIGFDLISGVFRPVAHSLLDVIWIDRF